MNRSTEGALAILGYEEEPGTGGEACDFVASVGVDSGDPFPPVAIRSRHGTVHEPLV